MCMALITVPQFTNNEVETDKDLVARLVTQIEMSFWLFNEYPNVTELANKLQVATGTVRSHIKEINRVLALREMFPYSEDGIRRARNELDPFFVVACNLLCDSNDKRSKSVKLKTVGMTTRRWEQLLEEPDHRDYFVARVDKAFNNVAQAAKLAIAKNVESGDLQSIKYFHEFQGIHDPNKEIQTNLYKIISLFMEVLIRHAPPGVVDAVSREFDVKLLELQ